jgi:4,5:9,10-diseco-3-hydroxy-5,9,17-trioxoandrosta-1(10),2-diene-4-oate hydrolase
MQPPEERYIKIGEINTRYWMAGDTGPQVLLIHGVGRFLEEWMLSFDALAAHNRVYALDLPGHGRTDKPLSASYRLVDLARFVNDFMGALDISQAHIVGHSMGGGIALQLTLQFPEAVDKLVLVCSAGLGKEATLVLRITAVPLLGEILTRPSLNGTRRLLKEFVKDPAFLTDDFVDLSYRMAALPGAQQAVLKTLRSAGNLFGQYDDTYRPIVDNLESIQCPVLIVWGRQDRVLPVAHGQAAVSGLPNANLEILEDCGHLPMLEQTQKFNESILDFLSS